MNNSAKNFVIWSSGIFIPELIVELFNIYSKSEIGIPLQYGRSFMIMLVSIYIVVTNVFYLKKNAISKFSGTFFILLSIFSFVYAALMLWLQYSLRNGFGF